MNISTKHKNHPFFRDNTESSYENTIHILQNLFENEFERYYKKHMLDGDKPYNGLNLNLNDTVNHTSFRWSKRNFNAMKNSNTFLTKKRRIPFAIAVARTKKHKKQTYFNKSRLTPMTSFASKRLNPLNQTIKLIRNEDILKTINERFSKVDDSQKQTNMKLDYIINNAREIFCNNYYSNFFDRSNTMTMEKHTLNNHAVTNCWEKDKAKGIDQDQDNGIETVHEKDYCLKIQNNNFEYISSLSLCNTRVNNPSNNNANTIDYFSFRIKPEMSLSFTADNFNLKKTDEASVNEQAKKVKFNFEDELKGHDIHEENDSSSLCFRSYKDEDEEHKVKPFPSMLSAEIYDKMAKKSVKSETNSLLDIKDRELFEGEGNLNLNEGEGNSNLNNGKDIGVVRDLDIKTEEISFTREELSVNAYSEIDSEKKKDLEEREILNFGQHEQDYSVNSSNLNLNDNQSQSEYSNKTDIIQSNAKDSAGVKKPIRGFNFKNNINTKKYPKGAKESVSSKNIGSVNTSNHPPPHAHGNQNAHAHAHAHAHHNQHAHNNHKAVATKEGAVKDTSTKDLVKVRKEIEESEEAKAGVSSAEVSSLKNSTKESKEPKDSTKDLIKEGAEEKTKIRRFNFNNGNNVNVKKFKHQNSQKAELGTATNVSQEESTPKNKKPSLKETASNHPNNSQTKSEVNSGVAMKQDNSTK